jgi:hypothetical protein
MADALPAPNECATLDEHDDQGEEEYEPKEPIHEDTSTRRELAFRLLQGHQDIACLQDGARIDAKGVQLDTTATNHTAHWPEELIPGAILIRPISLPSGTA